ncbi:MAG: thiouridylase [Bacteroides sp. SM23_62_1]|nr:MAG: thiouridylase [Bacteroides sp. SM23_62_1]
MPRVVVGLSGGVDSSVAAYLLKKEGYDVTAVFMINWHDKTGTLEGDCPWKDDLVFAQLVARKLKIPFHSIDLSKEYKKRVVDYMFREYEKGRTPNPDVLCNREIKFDEFLKATAQFNPDFVATGHYCRKETIEKSGKRIYRLLAGKDPNKEQSYFLCQVYQEQLSKVLFPVGDLEKAVVRKIAHDQQLPTAKKKDSQGICFIGKVDLPTFLQQKLEPKQGDVIEIPKRFSGYLNYDLKNTDLLKVSQPFEYQPEDGIVIGKHRGAHFFTIGQRKGMNIGGKKEPLFVIATDTLRNIVYTGAGHTHPGLYRKGLFIQKKDIHWIRDDLKMNPGEEKKLLVRIRYRQPLQKATLVMKNDGMHIIFERMQRGITPGQFAAWYDGEELLGSGCIT